MGPIETRELKRILDGEGLICCATHEDFFALRDKTQEMVDKHRLLECEYVAIGGLPSEYRNGEGYGRFAREALPVAAKLAQGGLTFCYHNHSFEFEKFGGRTGFEILYSESDPKLFNGEPDTYWIQHGGGDPAQWITWLGKRAKLIHLKDMAMKGHEQKFAEVGEGNLNWPAILKTCKVAKAAWYIVEQDTCAGDPFDSLAISLRNLKSWETGGAYAIKV